MTETAREIRIGTRGSKLALWQAKWVKRRIEAHVPTARVTIEIIKTQGDQIVDQPLSSRLGRAFFTKEIEDALLEERVDLAVHSLKDLPTSLPPGLMLAAIPTRAEPYDCLVGTNDVDLDGLAPGSRIGTGSLRRVSQIKHLRPDLLLLPIRGNLDTRLKKLEAGDYDAIVLAEAGLRRLGIDGVGALRLDAELMVPAVGQGALGIEIRETDSTLAEFLTFMDDPTSRQAVEAERSFLATLEGGCQVPAGALATVKKGQLRIQGMVADPEGRRLVKAEESGPVEERLSLGRSVAERILEAGGRALLELARHPASILLLLIGLTLANPAQAYDRVLKVMIGNQTLAVESVTAEDNRLPPVQQANTVGDSRGRLIRFANDPTEILESASSIPHCLAVLDESGRILVTATGGQLSTAKTRLPGTARFVIQGPENWLQKKSIRAGDFVRFVKRQTLIGGIAFGDKKLEIEVVDTPAAIQTGLMYRKSVPENAGMLFVFEKPRKAQFWMKNTYVPLSIAFLDKKKKILNIEDMKPLDEESRTLSRGSASYALEVNQGWFKANGVQAGDVAEFLMRTVHVVEPPQRRPAGSPQ